MAVDQFLTVPVIGSGAGWASFGGLAIYVVRKITTGDLITRRESDADKKRIASLEAANTAQAHQLNVLVETTRPAGRIIEALTAQGGE